ncbi:hypothetical protein ADUPG1_001708, partial [Aduncisulcus paluster]
SSKELMTFYPIMEMLISGKISRSILKELRKMAVDGFVRLPTPTEIEAAFATRNEMERVMHVFGKKRMRRKESEKIEVAEDEEERLTRQIELVEREQLREEEQVVEERTMTREERLEERARKQREREEREAEERKRACEAGCTLRQFRQQEARRRREERESERRQVRIEGRRRDKERRR